MDINDVIKLVDAGFTAQQISAMINANNAPSVAAPEISPQQESHTDEKPAVPAPEPVKEEQPAMQDIMAAIDQKFNDLATTLRGSLSPSIPDIKPLGVEDIISKFFKED